MSRSTKSRLGKKTSYVMAMFVGTALTALSPSTASAEEQPNVPHQTIVDVTRYCSACWRNARLPFDQWHDCTQEVLCRLLQTVPAKDWPSMLARESDERRELVRAIDTVKKRTQRQKRSVPHALETCSDTQDKHRRRLREERATVEQAARRELSTRQQRILQLSMDGWSVQQISRELKVSPERISDEKYKAVRKLRASLS